MSGQGVEPMSPDELFPERNISHTDGPETEHGYSEANLGERREIVKELLQMAGGVTGGELEAYGARHAWQPRITEWKNAGHAYDSGRRRINPRSGAPNIVWLWRDEPPPDWDPAKRKVCRHCGRRP